MTGFEIAVEDRSASRVRLDSLTGLRFLAALLVFLHHAWGYTQYPKLFPLWPSFEIGHVAVGFFFMLSGFVLTWSLVVGTSARVLIGRRIAKIYPLHLLTLLLAALVLPAAGRPIDWSATAPSLLLLQAWFPDPVRYAINGPSWSISAELFFYLLFPFIVLPLMRVRRWILASAVIFGAMAIIAVVIWVSVPWEAADYLLYTFPPFRLGEFAIGVLFGAAVRRGWRPLVGLRTSALVCLVTFIVFTGIVGVVGDTAVPRGVFVVGSLPAAILLIAAAAQTDLSDRRSLLSSRALVKLGDWSFAFYLIHLTVLILLRPYAHGPASAVAVLAVALALTVVLSAVAHQLFERPLERRLRRWLESR